LQTRKIEKKTARLGLGRDKVILFFLLSACVQYYQYFENENTPGGEDDDDKNRYISLHNINNNIWTFILLKRLSHYQIIIIISS
jgi:hypothetical protein